MNKTQIKSAFKSLGFNNVDANDPVVQELVDYCDENNIDLSSVETQVSNGAGSFPKDTPTGSWPFVFSGERIFIPWMNKGTLTPIVLLQGTLSADDKGDFDGPASMDLQKYLSDKPNTDDQMQVTVYHSKTRDQRRARVE